jgi:5-methylthioribose kinase
MRLVDETSAADYLRQTARIGPDEPVTVRELGGGVSNMVLLVERPRHPSAEFVLKQARPQLRTSQPWFSRVERIWREADVLSICARLLANEPDRETAQGAPLAARTPRILFEDRPNYLLAISAAPRPNIVWKAELLAGRIDPRIAAACGTLLGTLHAESWLDPQIQSQLGDRSLFDELRLDPYYRTLAAACPEARADVDRAIASLAAHPRSLVHADFSPKNLLVHEGGLLMVDFETGHFGDPAFDLGFFLSHLVLKACLHAPRHAACLDLAGEFCRAYENVMVARVGPDEHAALWTRAVPNLALCAWARLDGKSPVEYLSEECRRQAIRGLARELLAGSATGWSDLLPVAARAFDSLENQA